MNNLMIFLAQTSTAATLDILFLLLVAGTIGFVTAWFFVKSQDENKLKAVEVEKLKLNSRLINKIMIINDLQKNFLINKEELDYQIKKVNALKALNKEAVLETDDLSEKNDRMEQLLHEKDEALIHIAQRKHLLDYKSFGTATEDEKDDLKMISGIGPFIEERLHALDIFTFRQISKFTANDIKIINSAIEYFSGRIDRDEWVSQAVEIVHNQDKWLDLLTRITDKKANIYYNRIGMATKEEADDLTTISGIGGWINKKLNALDIYTFKQIGNFNNEDILVVTEAIEFFPGRIEKDEWIIQAQELVRIAGKKAELFHNISERKGKIYYDRLGVAHKHEANNLTLINGIGLWIEERLNMLDIYTFNQISRLTHTDIEVLTEILGIPQGRIERDNWVKQANGLLKTQLHPAEELNYP
jgi:predicted flap endonuclease-1-like 5' DNA nuclease